MLNLKNRLSILNLYQVTVRSLQIDINKSISVLFTNKAFVSRCVFVTELPCFFFVDVEEFVPGHGIVENKFGVVLFPSYDENVGWATGETTDALRVGGLVDNFV